MHVTTNLSGSEPNHKQPVRSAQINGGILWIEGEKSFEDVNPIELLRSLMEENKLKSKDLVDILGVSKGLVSDILNYKKGLSKEIIRTLSTHFSISQEAFNRPYKLISPVNSHLRNASVMNTHKELA